jgi:hypothetical protein
VGWPAGIQLFLEIGNKSISFCLPSQLTNFNGRQPRSVTHGVTVGGQVRSGLRVLRCCPTKFRGSWCASLWY